MLALAVWLVGVERLRRQLGDVDRAWLAAAVATMALSQCVSVYRWGTIVRIFGLRVRQRALAVAYAQGLTLNVLLPGATLGGDALRSVRLQALGNPLGVSALTVLLDRLSGLWILCVLSLLTSAWLAGALALGWIPVASAGQALGDLLPRALPGLARVLGTGGSLAVYLAGLLLLCALPWLPLRRRGGGEGEAGAAPAGGARAFARRLWSRICRLHDLAIAERVPLARSLWSSLLVQLLCALTLWLCALAAGGHADYWRVQAVAAPVFIAGALPVSYGGFGAREIVALVAFPLVGMTSELGLAASALYGIVAIILGLATAPAFALSGWAAAPVQGAGRGGAEAG